MQAQGKCGTWRPTGLEVLKVLGEYQTSFMVARLTLWVCLYVYLKKKKKKKLEIESIYNVMFQVYSKVVRLYLCMYSFSDCFPL